MVLNFGFFPPLCNRVDVITHLQLLNTLIEKHCRIMTYSKSLKIQRPQLVLGVAVRANA